ncbi:uncharacterized protein LOC131937730 [Physella acuta]|uniref:uncharacterized protein LOC131937730 n=1 Tax=Physella acuta TaxID=109671 RepID=UPI0027DCCFEF|nr:uncharacterized protein LOC131937730 [Physella acuta]
MARNMFVLLVTACVFLVAEAAVGSTCQTAAECEPGECCQILSEFMVASRRQAPADVLQALPRTGSCQKYTLEGGNCDTLDKMNGYCSCEPGTYCHMYEVPLTTARRGVRGAPMVRPGYTWVSKCEKTTA